MNHQKEMRFVTALAVVISGILTQAARADTFNIEVDYMAGGSPFHSHDPGSEVIAAIVQMFACHGHTLNINLSDAIPEYAVLVRDPNDSNNFFNYSGVPNSFKAIKNLYYGHAGQAGWHYCIFAHQYQDTSYNTSGSSGLAELGGDDLVVTLGGFPTITGTAFERAATLAHEFGHNLGLNHCVGAGANCDNSSSANWIGQNQPNYASIMSYFYQLTGVHNNLICQGLSPAAGTLFKEIDYSNGTMCTWNEASLDETFGSGMMSVDWNCDGSTSGVVAHDTNGNSNGWCSAAGQLQTISDYDDWSNIHDVALTANLGDLDRMPEVSCVTAEEMVEFYVRRGGCTQPTLATENCIDAKMLYLTPGGGGPTGRCMQPFGTTQAAYNAMTDNSIFYYRAGTYIEPGPLTLNRPLTMITVGGTTTIRLP